MNNKKIFVLAAFTTLFASHATAQLTEKEISQLGTSLTPLGAIQAGNEAGTIPSWEGGACSPPANYQPIEGERGGSPYADLFPDEQPLFSITAENMAEHQDKLDVGTQDLFRRYPDSFRVDVYPTHRTACFPQWVYDNTIERVKNPRLVGDAPGLVDAHAQVPFPIPKDGFQAMWNSNVKFDQVRSQGTQAAYLVDSSGGMQLTSVQDIEDQNLYWDNSIDQVPANQPYWTLIANTIAPASVNGVKQMRWSFLNTHERDGMAWSYVPGQRRVRLAPEFKYDTVSTQSGGVLLFDEINGFDGKMDKYDFKLIGRKEMYMPYNSYKAWAAAPEELNTPKHHNPDLMRWELRRIWEVEGTLKDGERHVQKTKRFFLDEDSWMILSYHGIDHADQVHHVMYQPSVQRYEIPAYRNGQYLLYDMSKGIYSSSSMMGAPGMTGFARVDSYPPNHFTPSAMAGSGLR
ncbi:MAG TPA: DUF1329 domain-containing protein [Pseudomonas xinjiangensis]|uniref:DUF1329 domain-containing protein n=2 Tax=root TaxID=1 RepID=A0A7V1BSJ8_9GAMM|nr:DUF1329 domain-containing protein [Halopseudomonas xinjiangensis]HEC47388.1 DUF1329 domain-containing protein [Halopseudomonas xinjiangensis]